MEAEKKCPCPKADCPRNTHCKECQAFHAGAGSKTRCQREREKAEKKA